MLWIRSSSVPPYFPCQLPLILMLTLLFAFPTYLLGVPSLGRENLPASEMGCSTSDHNSASNLGLLCVFLSLSHASCIAKAQHSECSAFGCACGTKTEGWIHKGLSGLEGMVTSLSPKILNASLQMSAKVGFHTDLHFQNQGSLLNPGFAQKIPFRFPEGKTPGRKQQQRCCQDGDGYKENWTRGKSGSTRETMLSE